MKGILCTTLAVVAVLMAGCRREAASLPSPEVPAPAGLVSVDGTPILREDIEAELARRATRRDDVDFDVVLEEAIQRQRMVAEARRLGLDREPATRRALEGVLIARLKERQLEPRLAGIQTATNPATAAASPSAAGPTPGQLHHVAWLRLQFNPRSSAQRRDVLRERMNEARTKALALGPDVAGFGSLAIDYSDDDGSRSAGGDLGWLSQAHSTLPGGDAVMNALAGLRSPGEISPVIEGREAFYLLRLIERRAATGGTNRARQDAAIASHRGQIEGRRTIERGYLEELRSRIPAHYHTNAIEEARAAWRLTRSASESALPGAPGGGPP